MEPEPPEAAFFACSRSRPNFVGAGDGSGTSDFRSRSRPKKLRLHNTDQRRYQSGRYWYRKFYKTKQYISPPLPVLSEIIFSLFLN